ncbi:hypothetical protein [Pontibacter pudoricolor]|uniref:hypothetical protein n=1 Tax=Pontibacter pudoricolor TaxID=2694930 RepID=UPI001390B1F7|nr:hypothetical protein [Pontibacter pudoricolor]
MKAVDKRAIELVAFGFADNPTEENKGFGIAYYFYLNLDTDSVFIQRRINPDDKPVTLAWTGTIKGISEDEKIREFINVSRETPNGFIMDTRIPELVLYCSYYYYSRYKDGDNVKYQLFTHHNLDKRFRRAVDLIMNAYQNSHLMPVSNFVEPDSIIVPIMNGEDILFGPPPAPMPPPPPPIRATINYTPL